MPRGGRSSLQNGLDREIYQVVRKIQDDQSQFEPVPSSRLTFAFVYDQIKNSNSSLNRRPKKLLEDSLERVLSTIQADQNGESSDDINDIQLPDEPVQKPSSNGLNKAITGSWVAKNSPASRQSPAPSTVPKRERQVNGEPAPKKRKTDRSEKSSSSNIDHAPPTHISLSDMGGIGPIIKQLTKLVALPMLQPHLFTPTGPQPTRGILLHGPPGCGKTMIANALAASLKTNFISISAPSIVSGMSGESEKALRDHFDEARKLAPCLMFIDEIDAITPKRENSQREMEKRIVAQLLICLDDLDLAKTDGKPVIVLAATNRPDSLDPALRRGGRFDKEIIMPVPNEKVREQILRALTRQWSMTDDVDFMVLARRTPGCVGADLKDLVSTAANMAMERYLKQIEEAANQETAADNMEVDSTPISTDADIAQFERIVNYCLAHPQGPDTSTTTNSEDQTQTTTTLSMQDFLTALPLLQPSALREGFATIPSTTFDDIGSLKTHITHLRNHLITPILRPDLYTNLHLPLSTGILLYGPPGTGKTLLAKAVANASHANFISVKGPELLNKYVGESERAVRQLFARARSSVPVIIFFDELDALVPRRDSAASEASSRVVNTLLTELDGFGHTREGIYVVAATNRPDTVDPAILRPGRLETLLYVGLPDETDRVDILRTLVRKMHNVPFDKHMDALARSCHSFSGADLQSLVRRAGYGAVERCLAAETETGTENETGNTPTKTPVGAVVTFQDFATARSQVVPSVSGEEQARFELMRRQMENKL